MAKAQIAVVRFPGSNCDLDAIHALRTMGSVKADLVWHEDPTLGKRDAIVLPGGFSFGDYLRGGAIAAKSPALERVRSFAESGRPVLGICNGFQVLTEAGLLPGALLRNSSLRFVCRWVNVRVERTDTPFTRNLRKGDVLKIPIAHNEGRFFAQKDDLARIAEDRQAVFRYCDVNGRRTKEANPTGTTDDIAGVSNKDGNVLGLMPHPERASEPVLSPDGSADGMRLFASLVESLSC